MSALKKLKTTPARVRSLNRHYQPNNVESNAIAHSIPGQAEALAKFPMRSNLFSYDERKHHECDTPMGDDAQTDVGEFSDGEIDPAPQRLFRGMRTRNEDEAFFASPPETVRKHAHPSSPIRYQPKINRTPPPPPPIKADPVRFDFADSSSPLFHKNAGARSNPFVERENRQDSTGGIDEKQSYDSFESSSSQSTLTDNMMCEDQENRGPSSGDSFRLNRPHIYTGSPIEEEGQNGSFYGTPVKGCGSGDPSPKDILSFPFESMFSPGDQSSPVPPTPIKACSRGDLTPVRNHGMVRNENTGMVLGNGYQEIGRFSSDFEVLGEIGNGSFGTVYKVKSRLDGCTYAVKEAKRAAKGMSDRNRMLKEVYALAALSDETDSSAFHIVRYHQAWMEENRLYIQTELCTCTLQQETMAGPLNEKRLYKLLREILLALELIHRNDMVHLDIKPENIFEKKSQFKLGDFGLVNKASIHRDVEEGDSRYMSKELMEGNHNDLTKSDIFSLGATMYEVCRGKWLPSSGEEWQSIRNGKLSPMPNIPKQLRETIIDMTNPNPSLRPSASDLLRRRFLMSDEQRELIIEKNKVTEANRALAIQMERLRRISPVPKPSRMLTRRTTWDVDMMNKNGI